MAIETRPSWFCGTCEFEHAAEGHGSRSHSVGCAAPSRRRVDNVRGAESTHQRHMALETATSSPIDVFRCAENFHVQRVLKREDAREARRKAHTGCLVNMILSVAFALPCPSAYVESRQIILSWRKFLRCSVGYQLLQHVCRTDRQHD